MRYELSDYALDLSSQPAPAARHYERKWCVGASRFVVVWLTNLAVARNPIGSPARAA